MKKTDWFTDWFNTSYYHILYKDRSDEEARLFMKNITAFLPLPKTTHILDLPCGKGRHSVFLNSLGYKVTGADLSENSIKTAKKFENDSLKFKVHDMRQPINNQYDAIFNLFTSFGYFEKEEDNLKTIKSIKSELKPNGYGVIDFLNSDFVEKHLVLSETKIVDGITFFIQREIKDGYIFKNIKFKHNNQEYNFTEKVKAISLLDFKNYFREAGVNLIHCFGDYQLNEYNQETSSRLILIFN